MMTASANDQVLDRLIDLVGRSTNGRIVATREDCGADSLRRVGLDSLAMLNFLVAVEDEFGIEWRDDVPKEVFASLDCMAGHIAKELGVAG
jgi:acyl carrier protein